MTAGRSDNLLRDLDQWQRDVVTADAAAVLVRAQVGSGKTTVLVRKVLWLHAHGVPLSRIGLLTFTNRAAADLRRRIAEGLAAHGQPSDDGDGASQDDGDSAQLTRGLRLAGTFHSVCRALLTRQLPIASIGYRPDFRVLDAGDRDAAWRRLIAEHGLKIRHKKLLTKRMAALNEGVVLHGAMKHPDDIVKLAELSHADKLRRNVMDFDDLLRNTHALLCDYPINPPLAALLIDELQDCDRDQLDLAEKMCGPGTQVLAVGDPNQVIYSWRGSSTTVMDEFALRTGAALMTLPMNYRCPESILEPARLLVQASGPAVAAPSQADDMVAARAGGEAITVMPHHDGPAQARWIVSQVRHWQASGVALHRLGVLARSRRGLQIIAKQLRDAEIPVSEQAADRARDVPVVAWLVQLLRAALEPTDDESFVIAFTHSAYGYLNERNLSVERLRKAREGGPEAARQSVVERASKRARGRNIGRLKAALATVGAMQELVRTAAAPASSADDVVALLGIDTALGPTASSFEKDRREVLGFVQGWLYEIQASGAATNGAAISDALLHALEIVAESQAAQRPRTGVAVLTMHASKGLEFDHVVIADANDGWVPLSSAWRSPEQLAEERRLLFVAFTRARESLQIGWLKAPGDRRAQAEPSPFLELLPQGSVRWLDAPPAFATAPPELQNRDDAAPVFTVGAHVRHSRYGLGVITRSDSDAVIAHFDNLGDKRFSPSMCPLQTVQ
jgi:DNA helicase II / ATP-dependent DNA helicase PcrA